MARFRAGQSGNYKGRPGEAFSERCCAIAEKRRLPELLGEVARGVSPFGKVDMNVRIKAAQILLHYGYGPPPLLGDEISEVPRIQFVKRIFDVNPEDV